MNDREEQPNSPAERFAQAQRRNSRAKTQLAAFESSYEFGLDPFQVQACEFLEQGHSVLVAAPTGSGKTVVGEFAIHLALTGGTRAFYTTPIKALSNQKYRDLCERHGNDNVGLLTGDSVVNGDAPVVVMTTEVLRNMLYERSAAIDTLSHVVMDEVHYLADRQRGAVWEEVILHLPERITLVALSATVSNAEEFGAWLRQVRGDTEVVVEERRPIPLHQHVLAGRSLVDLFVGEDLDPDGELEGSDKEAAHELRTEVNPVLIRRAQEDSRSARFNESGRGRGRGSSKSRGRPQRGNYVSRPAVLERLDRAGLLPAIVFVFSRRGCDEAVKQCLASGIALTDAADRAAVRAYVDERCGELPDQDLAVLGYYEWREGLERGIAAHHAGMLPMFKETVEELFSAGYIKAVFATETLALGINMPARSVVLERLVKWNGSTHADVTAGEYTQLTGRAGRRGIDVEGHAVTVWHNGIDPQNLAGLASTRTYPLKSSFRPSYNMAVNLIERMGVREARGLLETSFAQYQADAGVVGLANQIRKHEQALAGYSESMTCHLGDFAEYANLRQELADRERAVSRDSSARRRQQVSQQLSELRVGDVVVLASGRRAGPALVVTPANPNDDEPRPSLLSLDRRVRRIAASDVPHGIEAVARMKVPRGFDARSANWRRDLARTLADRTSDLDIKRPRKSGDSASPDEQIEDLRRRLRSHPCHGCSDREAHARWAERYNRLNKETKELRRRVESRTNTIARQFDRVCAVLNDLGYLTEQANGTVVVTPDGNMLAGLYADQDLLTSECIREGVWAGLNSAELAGAAAALVFESRGADEGGALPPLPRSPALAEALAQQLDIAEDLAERESRHHVNFVRRPNPGFTMAAWSWAKGNPLHTVLRDSELAPGDFVRWCRQLIDLMAQISDAAPDAQLRRTARDAMAGLRRGVVSYTGVDNNDLTQSEGP